MSLDSDIIHPRNQGGYGAEFIETWADRKARKPAAVAAKPKQNGPLPRIRSPEDVQAFKDLYLSGIKRTDIGKHFGICLPTVWQTATRLGLKRKRSVHTDMDYYVSVSAHITMRDYLRMKKHCGSRRGALAKFVRSAVLYKLDSVSA